MKIVIAGGTSQAEFIISMFKGKTNQLIVINPSKTVADTLAKRCRVTVTVGDPWRRFILEEAGAYDADVFISLCDKDTDNYAACTMAKKVFAVKKTICVVNNPKNVELYKRLGLDSVISSTYLLAQSIRGESSLASITKTLSIDNDKINVVESVILSKYQICFQKIKDINFPHYASIAAIYRNYQIIIPSGMVELLPKDTLLMVTAPGNIKKLLGYVQQEREGGQATIDRLIKEREAKKAREEERKAARKQAAEEKKATQKSEAPAPDKKTAKPTLKSGKDTPSKPVRGAIASASRARKTIASAKKSMAEGRREEKKAKNG